jgi:PQQ-dependent catabolism-associated beta-propeller protein
MSSLQPGRTNMVRTRIAFATIACALVTAGASAKDTGIAYASSEKDHALTMIDVKSQAVVGTLPTCQRPRHMQLLAGGAQLIVACGDSKQADIIELASRKSVGKVPLGDDPEILDISPDGKTLYVSNEEDAELGIVDMATKKRTGAIEVGEELEGVKVSPDGKWVFVTSEVASLVHAIDRATGKVVKNIKVGMRPRRLAFNADASELWVSNELAASVSVISVKDLAVTHMVKFEVKGLRAKDITPVDLKLAKDGKTMYVGLGQANHVAFVDAASKKAGTLALAGKRAWGLGVSPDGATLWVANGLSDDVTVIDTATGKPLKTVKAGRVPHSVVVD